MAKKTTKSKSSKKASASKPTISNKLANIQNQNVIVALLLAAQAVAVLLLSKVYTIGITTSYLTVDPLASKAAGQEVLASASRHLFDLNIAYAVGVFLLISACAHGAVASIHRKNYEQGLTQRINRVRWIDYSLSSSVMIALIALLNGIYDVLTLMGIVALVVLLHGLGYVAELQSKSAPKLSRLSLKGLIFAGAIVWLVIAISVKSTIVYGMTQLPAFVYWIDGIVFALLLAVAANIILSLRAKGRWSNYLTVERIYLALGFILRTILAWQIFAAVLH